LFAGKNLVIGGYGWCGRGVAVKARGLGANVIVTEVNPVRALEARIDGFQVMKMSEAVKIGDIFITATGNKSVINKECLENLKEGAILSNTGHFNCEIDIAALEELTVSKRNVRTSTVEHTLRNGRKVYLLVEGRLVNLAAAEGHPSEVMDMSFANQALSVEFIVKNKDNLQPKVYEIDESQDKKIAGMKLQTMGIDIDVLTPEQEKYLSSWEEGT
jgi:adenosylhomocysteinase